VWAPARKSVGVHLFTGSNDRYVPMAKDEDGYHGVLVGDLEPGSRYLYRLDDTEEHPDPASRFQPDGVHRPSEIIDLSTFNWTDAGWQAPSLEETVFYEVHVGTYSEEGSLDGLRAHLTELADLGVTTVELMPLGQFPGSRNWGYDGVYPFAVQNSYGGPRALQRFVDAAHNQGLAVALDVVYNHLGPEGNYLNQFGPYFTNRYGTPWGQAINYDGSESGPVRRFFIENALYWFNLYHIDALRLDAVHGIYDFGALHFLAELQRQVESASKRLGRNLHLIAESDLNDARVLLPRDKGGYGLAAQWSDDCHHALHALLTHETGGYYADFGSLGHLGSVFRKGWFYEGQHSRFRRRQHGNSPEGISRSHFVVCSQNHDHVGNRARGERLSSLVDFEAQKLAAGVTLLSPFVPLLFMGEEYGEKVPFQYFTSHGDKHLIEAVRRGRREEFAESGWDAAPPDPQNDATFEDSKLHHALRDHDPHRTLRLLYQELMRFRRANHLGADADLTITENESLRTLTVLRRSSDSTLLMLFNFGAADIEIPNATPSGQWLTQLNSADSQWLGLGNPRPPIVSSGDPIALSGQSFLVLRQQRQDGGF
jgi:maltooligosyltrehalose trehalohydrolase